MMSCVLDGALLAEGLRHRDENTATLFHGQADRRAVAAGIVPRSGRVSHIGDGCGNFSITLESARHWNLRCRSDMLFRSLSPDGDRKRDPESSARVAQSPRLHLYADKLQGANERENAQVS